MKTNTVKLTMGVALKHLHVLSAKEKEFYIPSEIVPNKDGSSHYVILSRAGYKRHCLARLGMEDRIQAVPIKKSKHLIPLIDFLKNYQLIEFQDSNHREFFRRYHDNEQGHPASPTGKTGLPQDPRKPEIRRIPAQEP